MNYSLKLPVSLHLSLRTGLARFGCMLSLKMSIIKHEEYYPEFKACCTLSSLRY